MQRIQLYMRVKLRPRQNKQRTGAPGPLDAFAVGESPMSRSKLQTRPHAGTRPQEGASVNICRGIDCSWRSCGPRQSERANQVTLAEEPPREALPPPSAQPQPPRL